LVDERDQGLGETEAGAPVASKKKLQTNPRPGEMNWATFFLALSLVAGTLTAIDFGLLEPSAFALSALVFFGAKTCSAFVNNSGWLSRGMLTWCQGTKRSLADRNVSLRS
jgi:hypothetical protein